MKNIKANLAEVKNRYVAPTPTHFKKVKTGGYVLAGIGLGLKVIAAIFPPTLPIALVALAPEFIAIGLTAAGVAKTSVVGNAADIVPGSGNIKSEKGIVNKILKIFKVLF